MPRNCPICKSNKNNPSFPYLSLWNNKEFEYVKCKLCKTTYVDPCPGDDDFKLMYSKEAYHDEHYDEVNVNQYLSSVDWLLSKINYDKNLKLLDFGCGNGSFLKATRTKNIECQGVEFDPDTIRFASENSGVPVNTLEEIIELDLKFNVIHLGDVFEHLPDPGDTFRKLKKLLTLGGFFFIEGPLENNSSLVYFFVISVSTIKKYLGLKNMHYSAPTHLVRTNRLSQSMYFTRQLKYQEISFCVYETGWPYLHSGASELSIGNLIKKFVGYFSIIVSKLNGVFGLSIGNRFLSLYKARWK